MSKKKMTGSDPAGHRPIPASNEVSGFIHCMLCLAEKPEGVSPRDYQRIQVGWTALGLQLWCVRHDCNVIHIDFEGVRHAVQIGRILSRQKSVDIDLEVTQ